MEPAAAVPRSINYGGLFGPQLLAGPQSLFAFNSAFFNAPFGQFAYTTGQQYLPQFVATLPSLNPQIVTAKEAVITSTTTTTTTTTQATPTQRPFIREREPTTRKPQGSLQVKPPKLQLKPEDSKEIVGDFKSDKALLKAVSKINPEFVIEEIVSVPGQHVYSTKSTEKAKSQQQQIQTQDIYYHEEQKQNQIQSQKQIERLVKKSKAQKKSSSKLTKPMESGVKVEAIGKTSTKGNIPEIPFDNYFLPYFSQQQQRQEQSPKKPAALILEPHSKAIVGNGGTAISTPISRAYLKRGVTTNVYFNPESVAIAGVGGKAHAQADLELDLIN